MRIISLSILLVFSFIIFSCNKDFGPISENINKEEYIGGIGNERVYELSIQKFKPNSNIPYITVPDSIREKLTFPDSLIKQGYIIKGILTRKNTQMNKHNFELIKNPYPYEKYIQMEGYQDVYNLYDAINKIKNNQDYTGTYTDVSYGVYLETQNKVEVILTNSPNFLYLLKPLKLNLQWIVREYDYKNENNEYEKFQEEAKVVDKVELNLKAGSFKAFKIEFKYHWIDLNYETIVRYEYYVPNIGLVLLEADSNIHSLVLNADGTYTHTYYREIRREELISYDIKN